jgi:sugar phosphate isomerase/epimerase
VIDGAHSDQGLSRRHFLASASGAALAAAGVAAGLSPRGTPGRAPLPMSLAQWSLHRTLFAGDLDTLSFPAFTRETFGLEAVEFVNQFFKDKAQDAAYLRELRGRADDAGVRCLLIMCDGEGDVGDPDEAARRRTVENHARWFEAAKALGCHAIRVNAASRGSYDEQQKLAAEGLRWLAETGEIFGLDVLVENHGGLSSNGAWLAGVMKLADHPRCGTLPDFGNFCLDWSRQDDPDAWYDRYTGVAELMPFAKAVSAKSRAFDASGQESQTDYSRMMRIVLEAGYTGHVGIEWEGEHPSEVEGVLATKRLLERVMRELAG